MSTIILPFSQSAINRCHELQVLLDDLRNEVDLLLPEQLTKRLNTLDDLDAIIGDLDAGALDALPEPELVARATALRFQFEAANAMVFQGVRAEIALIGSSPAMNHWFMELVIDGGIENRRCWSQL